MTTFVLRSGRLVEKSKAPPKSGVFAISDIEPFVTQEGVTITSRSHLRSYEQANGVRQVGNDFVTRPIPGIHS